MTDDNMSYHEADQVFLPPGDVRVVVDDDGNIVGYIWDRKGSRD